MPRQPLLQVTVSPDAKKLAALVDTFPLRLFPVMRDNVQESFTGLKDVMQKRSSEGPLYRRTGQLRRSWGVKPEGFNIRTFTSSIGSFSSYSVKHETGGDFFPMGAAKYFWIPLGPNLKPNRTAKFSPTQAIDFVKAGKWRIAGQAKGSPDLAIAGKRNVILNENNEPVYVRVRAIRLKAVLGFAATSPTFVRHATERLSVLSATVAAQEFAKIKHQ
jgi:hypothetical protein